MNSLKDTALESNTYFKINFDGGDLSSDALFRIHIDTVDPVFTAILGKDADKFMIPLLKEYRTKYPSLPLYLRGDSGFAAPELYDVH